MASIDFDMDTLKGGTGNGLRQLTELAEAAGAHWTGNTLHLPASMGTGQVQLLALQDGVRLAIHRYVLTEEITVHRQADDAGSETLLFSFHSFGAAFPRNAPLSTAQLASSTIAFTTTLPAQTNILLLALAIRKSVLLSWLPAGEELPPAFRPHPLVLDTLLTSRLQAVLQELSIHQPAPSLASFFYRIKVQELVYWLLHELADRGTAPSQPLHAADVTRIYRVRELLLADLRLAPPLVVLAQAVGLSETRLKRLFRQVFGTSPYEYYQQARLAEARRLLPHFSVAEVGYQLGFTNLSHFARLFARYYGLPPKKYQATLQGASAT